MQSAKKRAEADDAFGAEPAPHARHAFGSVSMPVGQRMGKWLLGQARLASLLVALAFATAGLVESHSVLNINGSTSSANEGGSLGQPTCTPEQPPVLATVDVDQLRALRSVARSVAARAGGHEYESGIVQAIDAWEDDPPERVTTTGSTKTHWTGSWEIRQWAPDPQWGTSYRDDVATDVFMFHTPLQARRFFAEAASARCRERASETKAMRPPGARELNWGNPDRATQEDLWLTRGRVAYRIADVRPGAEDRLPSTESERIGFRTIEALACGLPEAHCR